MTSCYRWQYGKLAVCKLWSFACKNLGPCACVLRLSPLLVCVDKCSHPGFSPDESQDACPMQDHSLRLWNLETQVCVCTMVGDGAHTNEVLSVVRPYLIIICVTGHQMPRHKMLSAALQRPHHQQWCNAWWHLQCLSMLCL